MNQESVIRFCATGKRGLGHLRRIANVARPLAIKGCYKLELITNAPVAGVAAEELEMFRNIHIKPRDEFARTLKATGKGPVVVDTASITELCSVEDPLILILREARISKIRRFRLDAGRLWDAVLLPNPAEYWSVSADTLYAKRIDHVGWIYRSASQRLSDGSDTVACPLLKSDRLNLLIACGGGGHITTEHKAALESIIRGLRANVGKRVYIIQALGPRSDANAIVEGADIAHEFGSNLNSIFNEADIVISTAGYNSVLELAVTTTPTLLFPVDTTYDDQSARARRWGELIGQEHVDIGDSIAWLTRLVSQYRRRSQVDLGPSGAEKAANRIEALLQ